MNILVVGQVFYPDHFRVNDVVEELARKHKVKVITGLPDYDKGHVPREYRWLRNRNTDFHGADVIRVPIISRRKGPFFRALNYMSFAVTGSIYAFFMKGSYDVTFSYQTSPITMFLPAAVYARKHKVRSVLYTLDLWPESVKAMNIQESSKLFGPIRVISRKIYESADKILVSSPSFKEYLRDDLEILNENIDYLPQYTEERKSTLKEVREREIGQGGKIQFTFAGNLGLMQDLDTIVRAVEIIPENYKFVVNMVGSGSYEEALRSIVKEKGLTDKIRFLGRREGLEMEEVYAQTDVCLLTLKNEGFIGKTIPGKLQTYIAKGKPIAAAISGDAMEVIEEAQCGFAAESGDYEGLAKNMMKYIEKQSLIVEHGVNALQFYLNTFNKEKFMRKLEAYLEGRD